MDIQDVVPGTQVQYVGSLTAFTGCQAKVLSIDTFQGLTLVRLQPDIDTDIEIRVPFNSIRTLNGDTYEI